MKPLTLQTIRALNPCYDPAKYLPETWQGTALDILKLDQVPLQDKLWVVLREGFLPDKTLRLFAVYCAREALKLVKNPDARSVKAVDVAERFALGKATKGELEVAWAAAGDARAAAWAARDAYNNTAAWAVWVARDAWAAAWDAAGAAAGAAARQNQVKKLIEMIEKKPRKTRKTTKTKTKKRSK